MTDGRRSFRGRLLQSLLALAVGLVPRLAAAQGGPPLLTDDPGTPGAGRTELNVAFTVEKHKDETLYEAPQVDFNFGVGERIQIKVELPWVISHESPGGAESGLGNLLLGFKYRFLDEDSSGIDLSVYPQFDFNTSAHSRRSGLVPEGMELLLPVEVARDLGWFAVNAELGYLLREEFEEEWEWGLALGRRLTQAIEILGEVHGFSSRSFDRAEMVFNLGARVKLSELNSILVSAGRGIRGESHGEPGLIGYLGLQFNF